MNKSYVLQTLSGGGEYTSRSMAEKTGLSVASCNTLLNELVKERLALSDERQMAQVGRKTIFYSINERYGSTLYVQVEEGEVSLLINYRFGGQRASFKKSLASVSCAQIKRLIEKTKTAYEGIEKTFLCVDDERKDEFLPLEKKEVILVTKSDAMASSFFGIPRVVIYDAQKKTAVLAHYGRAVLRTDLAEFEAVLALKSTRNDPDFALKSAQNEAIFAQLSAYFELFFAPDFIASNAKLTEKTRYIADFSVLIDKGLIIRSKDYE